MFHTSQIVRVAAVVGVVMISGALPLPLDAQSVAFPINAPTWYHGDHWE